MRIYKSVNPFPLRKRFKHIFHKNRIVVYKKRVSSTFFHIFPDFPHFSTFSHIFPNFSIPITTFPKTVAANYTIVKRKWGIPKTLLMDTLILNLKPFVSESLKKAVPQNIFPKLL